MASRRGSFGGFGGGPGGRFTTNNRFARLFEEGAGDPNDIKSTEQGLAFILNSGLEGFFLGKDRDERDAADAAIAAAFKPDEAKVTVTETDEITKEDEEILDDGVSDFIPEFKGKIDIDRGRSLQQRLLDKFASNPDNEFLARSARRLLPGLIANEQTLTAAGVAREQQLTDAQTSRETAAGVATTKFGRDKELSESKRRLSLKDTLEKLQLTNKFAIGRDETKALAKQNLERQKVGLPPVPPQVAGSIVTPDLTPSPPPSAGVAALTSPQQSPVRPLSIPEAVARNAALKKTAEETAKADVKAREVLPKVENNAKFLIEALDDLVAPKLGEDGEPILDKDGNFIPGKEPAGLSDVVGAKNLASGAITRLLPDFAGGDSSIQGTDAANFEAKLDRVGGKAFLQAFETLKGGGQITEVEGKKATQALVNLSTAQTEKQFRKAVLQFRKEVKILADIARKRAGKKAIPNDLVPVQ